MKTILKTIMIMFIVLLNVNNIKFDAAGVGDPINQIFPDSNMATAVANSLGKTVNDVITQTDVDNTVNLNVSSKVIADITGISVFNKLVSLDVSKNQITALPNEITSINTLVSINASDNLLITLPTNMGNMPNLIGINVVNNKIQSLPSSIAQLTGPISLRFEKNQIIDMPTIVGNFLNDQTEIYVTNQQTYQNDSGQVIVNEDAQIDALPIQLQLPSYNNPPNVTYTLTNASGVNTVFVPTFVNNKIVVPANLINEIGNFKIVMNITNDDNLLFLNNSTYTQNFEVINGVTLTLLGDNPMKVKLFDTFVDPGAVAYDSFGNEVPITTSGAVDTSKPGTYYITYNAIDEAIAIREVIVVAPPPTINENPTLPNTSINLATSKIVIFGAIIVLFGGIRIVLKK